jgi:hypothetical protein
MLVLLKEWIMEHGLEIEGLDVWKRKPRMGISNIRSFQSDRIIIVHYDGMIMPAKCLGVLQLGAFL